MAGSVLYDINELNEMSYHTMVSLKLEYPIHVCAELQDKLLLPESIKSTDHLTEMVDLYTSQLISESMLANLLEAADDDLITRIAEFVRTRTEADGNDLDTLPKADLMQIIVDAAMDEGVPDDDIPDTEDLVLDMLIQQGDVPASYQEQEQ